MDVPAYHVVSFTVEMHSDSYCIHSNIIDLRKVLFALIRTAKLVHFSHRWFSLKVTAPQNFILLFFFNGRLISSSASTQREFYITIDHLNYQFYFLSLIDVYLC